MTQEAYELTLAEIGLNEQEQPQVGSGTADYLKTPEEAEVAFFNQVAGGGSAQFKFKMRGRDDGRTPPNDFIVWIADGEPDFAGAGFATGTPTPIGSLIPGSVVKVATLTGE